MTLLHKYWSLIFGLLLLSSCNHDEDVVPTPTPINDDVNVNANLKTFSEYSRLEMPKLHNGSDTILIHKSKDGLVNYITEWDYKRKTQRWSCYVLNSKFLESNTTRYYSDTNQYPDDEVISESLQWLDDPYYGNAYKLDHGHICPSADRLSSADVNYQTFYLTNMQPQFNAYNAGLWAKMESKVRSIAKQCDTLYICKGGTVDGGQWGGYNKIYRTLDNGLIVPRFFYMALLRVNNGNYTAMALWSDQVNNANDSGSNLGQYAITIDELEARTGIDFFCNLPDKTENEVEKTFVSTGSWGLY